MYTPLKGDSQSLGYLAADDNMCEGGTASKSTNSDTKHENSQNLKTTAGISHCNVQNEVIFSEDINMKQLSGTFTDKDTVHCTALLRMMKTQKEQSGIHERLGDCTSCSTD